jgi:hypothetical protein
MLEEGKISILELELLLVGGISWSGRVEFLVLGVEIRRRCSCFQKSEGSSVNYLRCAPYKK